MKSSTLLTLAAMAIGALAQDPGPSPTNSVGCQPHGDHWHCAGPKTDGAAAAPAVSTSATAAAASSAAAVSSVNPGPSPANSVGCEPHGDHWHCAGPKTDGAAAAATTSAAAAASSGSAHDDHDDDHSHSHAAGTAKAGPSPTESVGCEPHGDHWHCAGPRQTTPAAGGVKTPTPSPAQPTGAAAGVMVPVAGLFAAAAFVL